MSFRDGLLYCRHVCPRAPPRRRIPALTNDPSPLFQPPEEVGPFRVRRALASGTVGPRLLVEDERGRLQVLKLITDVGGDAAALVGVLEHVRDSLPLHPGLLPITDIGVSDEGVYLASPVVSAPSVEARLHGGRQSLEATLSWLRGVVAGVQAAHEAGVWHGAIHPKDVLVGDEGGLLTGMGLAPALEHLKLQAPVRVPYTAPERASGRGWDARADQYSLAMLALDALSGRRLIAGTIPAFDRWTLAETPTEDARLHDVFVRALHPDPEQRYPSLEAWLDDLAGTVAGEEGALSRFAREGVILAAPGAAADAGREIEVQELEVPETAQSALSLFPEEDGATVESQLVETAAVVADGQTPPPDEPDAEQEWLVAAVPDDGVDHVEPIAPLIVTVPSEDVVSHSAAGAAVDDAGADAPRWVLDDDDHAPTVTSPARSWDPVPEESSSRGPLVLALVALILLAIGYGTWRSLRSPAPVTTAAGNTADTSAQDATGPADASPDDSVAPGETTKGVATPKAASPARPSERPIVPQAPVGSAGRAPTPRAPATAAPRDSATAPAGARAAAETTPAPEPATGTGRALIRSSPSGEVRVNGRSQGETPVVLRDLPFGSYVVSISRPGFETVEREVALLPSQPVASLTVDLVRSGSASSPADASARPMSQGGAGAAAASTESTAAPAGSATAGSAPPVAAGPAPARPLPADGRAGSLFVVSTPAQARLTVDGRSYGSTPAVIPGLSPGAHTVRIEARGYRTWEGQVQVQPGTRARVQATLQQEQE